VLWSSLVQFAEALETTGLAWEALTPVYGLAEATLAVSISPPGRGPVLGSNHHVRLGAPVEGTRVRVDEGGRIELAGDHLMAGYVDADGLDPFTGEWFTTSDVGQFDEGEVCVRGRVDEVVCVRGRNIFAEDLELVVLSELASELAAVAAFRLQTDATAPTTFGLALELSDRESSAPERVARAAAAAVARAVGITVGVLVVCKPWSLPRTTSGKIQRAACRALEAEQAWPQRHVLLHEVHDAGPCRQ
jgi:acyl-CoA synthetase (AMP-forming)/AMP-acid ligase II